MAVRVRSYGGDEKDRRSYQATADAVDAVSRDGARRLALRRPVDTFRAAAWDLIVASGITVFLPPPGSSPIGSSVVIRAQGVSVTVRVAGPAETSIVRGAAFLTQGASSTITYYNAGDSWV